MRTVAVDRDGRAFAARHASRGRDVAAASRANCNESGWAPALATAVILIVLAVAHAALNEQSKGERNEKDNRRVGDLFGKSYCICNKSARLFRGVDS